MSKTFDRPKLDEDMEVGIRGLYQDHGYFKVNVNVQDLKTVDLNHGGVPLPIPGIGSKNGKATNITISIEEGEQYRMGKLLSSAAPIPIRGWSLSPNSWRAYSL